MYDYSKFPHFRLDTDHSILPGWQHIFLSQVRKVYSKRSVILEQDEYASCLYYILSGFVEYTYTDEIGTESLIEVIGPGSIFPLQPFFGRNAALGSFVTLMDATLVSINEKELYAHMDRDGSLTLELLKEFAKITEGLMRQLRTHDVSVGNRVEEVLCILCESILKEKPDTKRIFLELTQGDLARITRTTRVTITKVMGALKKKGILDTAYGSIIVKNYDELRKLLN